MTKLIDIYEELDSDKIIYLEDIFEYLDETEVHIIRTALGFSRTKSTVEGSYLVQGDNLSPTHIDKLLVKAEGIIDAILKNGTQNDVYIALKNIFQIFFNVSDAESLTRFEQVEANWQHIEKHGEEEAIWSASKKEHWLVRFPEKFIDIDGFYFSCGHARANGWDPIKQTPLKEEA